MWGTAPECLAVPTQTPRQAGNAAAHAGPLVPAAAEAYLQTGYLQAGHRLQRVVHAQGASLAVLRPHLCGVGPPSLPPYPAGTQEAAQAVAGVRDRCGSAALQKAAKQVLLRARRSHGAGTKAAHTVGWTLPFFTCWPGLCVPQHSPEDITAGPCKGADQGPAAACTQYQTPSCIFLLLALPRSGDFWGMKPNGNKRRGKQPGARR